MLITGLKTGQELSDAIWNAFGALITLGIMGAIAWKFFLGQQRNIIAGIGCIIGVAVLFALGMSTDAFKGIGNTLLGVFTN